MSSDDSLRSDLQRVRHALYAATERGPTPAELRDASRTLIAQLTAERDALREALEEACRCDDCAGSGRKWAPYGHCQNKDVPCRSCSGTGRDYHGSEKARQLMEGKL